MSRADDLMEEATTALEDGNVELAKKLYEESLGVSEGATAWFNLGVSPCYTYPASGYKRPAGGNMVIKGCPGTAYGWTWCSQGKKVVFADSRPW